MQKKLVILGITLTIWGGLVFAAWQFTELKFMFWRFIMAYSQVTKGSGTMTGLYGLIGGIFLAALLLGGVFEYQATQKNKDPLIPAGLAAFMVMVGLGLIHLVLGMYTYDGPFYQFGVEPMELLAVPGLTGVLYLVLRFSLFGRREDSGGDGELRRGIATLDKPSAALRTFKRMAKAEGDEGALIHSELRLPRGRETKHLLLVGSPGSGKTQVMFPLLQDVVSRGESAIVYDFKGDYAEAYGELAGAVILSPFDERGWAWDIAADLDSKIKISEFSASLIPEADAREPFFRRGAQDALTAVMLRLQHEKPGQWAFGDVVKMLSSKDEILRSCAEFNPAALHALGDGSSDQAGGVLGELRTSTMQLEYLAEAWDGAERKFSVTRWVQDDLYRMHEARLVILQGSQQYRGLEGFLTSMTFGLVIKNVLSLRDSHTRRLWAFLDEFGNLPAIAGIDTMLTAVRSKGLRVVAAVQDVGQIEKAYSPAFAKIFFGCFGTVLAGHAAGDTARYLSDFFGKNQVERTLSSASKSRGGKTSRQTESEGQQIVIEHALLDNDFANIESPSLKVPATFWLRTAGWPVGRLQYQVKPTPKRFAGLVPARWVNGMGKRYPAPAASQRSRSRATLVDPV